MADYEITATRKDGPDPDYRIDAFKVNGVWYTLPQMLDFIRQGHTFYVWVYRRVAVYRRTFTRTMKSTSTVQSRRKT